MDCRMENVAIHMNMVSFFNVFVSSNKYYCTLNQNKTIKTQFDYVAADVCNDWMTFEC